MSYRDALNIEELRRTAKKRLPRVAYDFLAGGVEDDVSLANNRAAFERIRLRPHTLVDVSGRSQQVSVFGKTFNSPFGIAPTGAAGLYGFAADIALAPLEALPEIRAAAGGRLALMVDSGFRRGTDIVKALALGADMVFVGRAPLYGITAGGEAGARHAIGILRSEIDRVLALLGCPSVRELNADYLWRLDKQGD